MQDLPTLLLSSGDSVAMSHTATMPLVKLPAIILWIKQRTQKCAKHVVVSLLTMQIIKLLDIPSTLHPFIIIQM
jgi:hypothetical protein